MKRVLVVDAVAEFVAAETVPPDITIEVFRASDGIPAGECAGLLPVITTRVRGADMDRLRGLRVIANYGVGYDNIDMAAARERGIPVSNTPGVLTEATAELTWALILAVARRLGEGERMVRAGAWSGWEPTQLRGTLLHGRTLGIIGAGRIGRAVGERARAFGMRVLYWSRTRQPAWEQASGAAYCDLDELLATADVASIHLAKASDTELLIDAAALARMQDGAMLINTARGAIVDEAALIAEVRSGRLRAGLDVFTAEPHVPAELRALENVVLLPHLGSATNDTRQAMWNLAWANLLRGVAGEPLLNPV